MVLHADGRQLLDVMLDGGEVTTGPDAAAAAVQEHVLSFERALLHTR